MREDIRRNTLTDIDGNNKNTDNLILFFKENALK